jgi:hypothetical protein
LAAANEVFAKHQPRGLFWGVGSHDMIVWLYNERSAIDDAILLEHLGLDRWMTMCRCSRRPDQALILALGPAISVANEVQKPCAVGNGHVASAGLDHVQTFKQVYGAGYAGTACAEYTRQLLVRYAEFGPDSIPHHQN